MDPVDDPDDILRANRSREKQYMFDVSLDGSASQVTSAMKAAQLQGKIGLENNISLVM
jgi:kinesin family protein 18/19